MEFIFIFPIILVEVILIHLFQIMEIVRTFRVYTFVQDEIFPVFLWNKGIAAMRAAQLNRRKTAIRRGEPGGTDLAEKLPFGTVVPVEKRLRGITTWAGAIVRDVTGRTAADRTDLLAITLFVVREKFFVSPVLAEVGDQREFINLEFLVFRRMGIIKSPLFEWDVSADKI